MKLHYAILSGVFAASAGAFGKLCGLEIFEGYFIVRVLFFGAMLVCNAAVWTLFVKALHQSESSLVATIISSTSNYLFTAFLGYFVLDEIISIYWWIGMLFIITGLVLVVSEDAKTNNEPQKKEE